MLDDELVKDLASATAAWLSFNALCGLDGLLTESALNIPVGTFIGTKSAATIESQFRHPYFTRKKPGRPRQIDFALRNSAGKVAQVIECKWANVGIQGVVDDLYRLECLGTKKIRNDPLAKGLSIARYFLIAGRSDDMSSFAAKGINVGRKRERLSDFLLSFDLASPKKSFNVEIAHRRVQEPVRRFQSAYYGKRGAPSIPRIIVTTLKGCAIDGAFRTYIWQVNRSKGTSQIKLGLPSNSISVAQDEE